MALFSIIMKAIIFPLGYIVLVKGNKKNFFKQALLGDLLNLTFSVFLFQIWGLFGLGIAYVLNYFFYGLYIYNMVNKQYGFYFFRSCQKLIIANLIIGILAVVIIYNFQQLYIYILISTLSLFSILYSLKELNQRINLKEFIIEKMNRNK
jgi:O-antigen/teichoic acid export membrane protein